MVRRVHEVESAEQLDHLLASEPAAAATWRLQDLDLSPYVAALTSIDVAGMVVLGGVLPPALEHDLRRRGALVFPAVPEVPFDAYRASLYTPSELYHGLEDGYEHTIDARTYAWSLEHTHDVAATLASALHDHAVDDALDDFVETRSLVGVMGGHAVARGTEGYAAAAGLGRALADLGWCVATGGGPGAMEAANLGARAAGLGDDDLGRALALVAEVRDFRPSVAQWADAGFAAAEVLPGRHDTVGIPTWFYGHEPPNVFATAVAKYFRNALREDTLLRLCDGGIVFLPGAAGTVQELFQDACGNYYATAHDRSPMVLVGRRYWTAEMPAWPLLQALGTRSGMSDVLHLVDTVDDAVDVLGAPH